MQTGFLQEIKAHIVLGRPVPLSADALTDKVPALSAFEEQYAVSWKEPGEHQALKTVLMTVGGAGAARLETERIPGAISSFGPASVTARERLFVFWINKEGYIAYACRASGKPWSAACTGVLATKARFNAGITAVVLDNGHIALGCHKSGSNKMILLLLQDKGAGMLALSKEISLKMARSLSYPYVSADGNIVRISWSRMDMVHHTTYDTETGEWTAYIAWSDTEAKGSPAVYTGLGMGRELWVWNRSGTSDRIQYMFSGNEEGRRITDLPSFFAIGAASVSFCRQDHDNFIMAYTDKEQKIQISYGSGYDPASWMEHFLFPAKAEYTLKDIVLPGAHDAGMSFLTARGGKSGYTINECNTLTQVIPVSRQLAAGIRMFDLRIDLYRGNLYTKHAPSDCMEDAVGGGWGEPLKQVLESVKRFLDNHNREIVLLSFAHFCERHMSLEEQARFIVNTLGMEKVYFPGDRRLADIPLKELAGKVLITFEEHAFPQWGIVSNTMTDRSDAFLNYSRAYAATNNMDTLLAREQRFFERLQNGVDDNDYIRLDWQLTQIGQEAALSCSQFQSEKSNPFLDGALLLTNVVAKNKSIIDLARIGNRLLPGQIDQWIRKGVINKRNKPNILYVDVADTWITDFCIDLNESALYTK